MMRIKDNRIESLEVLDWLKMMYEDKVNANYNGPIRLDTVFQNYRERDNI